MISFLKPGCYYFHTYVENLTIFLWCKCYHFELLDVIIFHGVPVIIFEVLGVFILEVLDVIIFHRVLGVIFL
jgi:hypothetical protein